MASISKIKIGSDEREIWAVRLKTASTIKLTGSVTGSISFDGSGGDVVINTSTNHTHSYLPLSGGTLTGNPTVNKKGARYIATNGTNSVWFGINESGTTWGIYDATNEKYLIQSDGTNIKLNGNAATATKVNKTLTVKLNGGTTEGTNMFTFDGSAEKVVNITPSSIGAAASSHGTHVSYGASATAVGTIASAGTASTISRSDHVHNLTKATVVAALGYTPPTSNTTYSAGAGLTLDGTTFKHSNSVTAATAKGSDTKTLTFGGTFTIPSVTFDAQGHITSHTTTTMTMPANPNSAHSHSAGVGLTGSGNAGTSGTYTYKVNLVNEAVASNAASYTAGGSSKFYAVQLDKNNKLGVYVPWSNTHAVSSVNSKTGAVTLDYSDVGASKAITGITRSGTTFTATHLDGTTTTFTQQDNNTTYSNMTAATASAAGKAGLVPAPAAGKQGQFLRGDGTWATPTNTTYTAMTGATASAAGKSGLVPAPAAGKQNSFLRGDGAWATPTNTTYTFATGDSNGQIKVTPSGGTAINVSVKGLGSAAYTASTAYDAAGAANTALANAKTYTDTKVAALVDSAPETLDTLNELAAALGDDPNFATTIATQIGNKANSSVQIIAGKGLTGGGNLTTDRTLNVGAGAGISVTADAVALATSGVTKGSYGPSANVTGSSGATVNIPYITVDEYGRVTAASTKTYTTMTVDSAMSASSTNPVQNKIVKSYIDGKIPNMDNYLPRSAGVNYPLTGPLGLTKDVMYGPTLPSANTFNGQLFFLEDSGTALPDGGSAGQVLVKNSTTDGDASWITQGLALTGDVSGSGLFNKEGNLIITTTVADDSHDHTKIADGGQFTTTADCDAVLSKGKGLYYNTAAQAGTSIGNDGIVISAVWSNTHGAQIWLDDGSGAAQMQVRNRTSSSWNNWRKVWMQGDSVTGAVWNDYAECRESDCQKAGYVLSENGDDTLSKSNERLAPFAGVSSDTWGFSQGETDKAKTPIAVAGRVLVYPYQDRNNYKPGDCVCAAPGGTVDIMTREEIINWPDRIVGTVSCVPDYEEWGGGENADRPSVKVNGRIWIKVK